jgi:3-hydroxyacyl-CoA dehydrogenase
MTEFQKAVAAPERCLLAHPYLPVHLMALFAVIGGRQTLPAAIAAAFNLM